MSNRGLQDKVVIVTGAGGGIARATALAFAAEGCQLVLTDIDKDTLDEVAGELRSGGTQVETIVADVTEDAGAKSVVDLAHEKFGHVDVLANVVGGSRPGKNVTEVSQADWNAVVDLNLTSTFLMCHYVLPGMEAQGSGAIVNVSSGAGQNGMKNNPAYCAAKAGVIGLTNALAIDHGPRGVRVNCVSPGPVLTPLMRRNRTPEEIAMIGKVSLLGRVANPEELADAIVWLASEQSSYVVGQTLAVNGGGAALV
jgi:NAD(P)-dependent dehydrogenase (short-subunit alcohol dehydrogenase family)